MNLGTIEENLAAGWQVAPDGSIWSPANSVPDTPAVLDPVEVVDSGPPLLLVLGIVALVIYLATTSEE